MFNACIFIPSFKVFETVFIEQTRIATDAGAAAFDPKSARGPILVLRAPASWRATSFTSRRSLTLKRLYLLGGRGASVESRVGRKCFLLGAAELPGNFVEGYGSRSSIL
jgi:hypothetical protein